MFTQIIIENEMAISNVRIVIFEFPIGSKNGKVGNSMCYREMMMR